MYGKYEFTADIDLTEDGKAYADLFSTQCEVTIESHGSRDLSIVGLAGATGSQGANLTKDGNIEIMDYNTDSQAPYFWGNDVFYGNENGESPWGNSWKIIYMVDPVTKSITVTDFTAITKNSSWATDKVLAKFTNCKLTFKEAAVIECADVSGEYHFKAQGIKDGSNFPEEADITLTATNETFSSYAMTINFGEGYKTLALTASFDGTRLDVPFKDAYLDEAQTLALCYFQDPKLLEGELTFTLGESGKTFSLISGMAFSRSVKDGEEVKYGYEQWYTAGAMSIPTENASNFAGSYHVTSANFWNRVTAGGKTDPYNYEYPTEFDIVVAYDEMMDGYYLEEFMGPSIYTNNNGATGCTVEGNTLKIPAGLLLDRVDTASDYVYHVLYDGVGQPTGTIDLTVNEDGTFTLGDFCLYRKVWGSADKPTIAAFYGTLSVTSGVNDVKTTDAAPKVSVANGVIYVMGEPAPVKVYSTAGALVYSGVTSAVSGLNRGMYIVKVGAAAVKVVL